MTHFELYENGRPIESGTALDCVLVLLARLTEAQHLALVTHHLPVIHLAAGRASAELAGRAEWAMSDRVAPTDLVPPLQVGGAECDEDEDGDEVSEPTPTVGIDPMYGPMS